MAAFKSGLNPKLFCIRKISQQLFEAASFRHAAVKVGEGRKVSPIRPFNKLDRVFEVKVVRKILS